MFLVFCGACLDLGAQEAVFQVKGTVSREVFKRDGSPLIRPEKFEFAVSVNGNAWFIRCTYGERRYDEYGTDGVDSFGILYGPAEESISLEGLLVDETTLKEFEELLAQALAPPKGQVLDKAVLEELARTVPAKIDRGTFPASASCHLRFVWTAFASAGYLKSHPRLPSPFAEVQEVDARIFLGTVETFDQPPFLPKKIVYKVKPWEKLDEYEFKKIRPGFLLKEGFVGGEYVVESVMEHQGLTLPKDFALRVYQYTDREVGKSLVSGLYRGKVDSVEEGVLSSYVPQIKDLADVVDRRFPEVQYTFYRLTNQKWPKVTDPIVVQARERAKRENPLPQLPRFSFKRLPFWIFIAVAAIPLVVLIFLRFIVKKPETPNTKGTA